MADKFSIVALWLLLNLQMAWMESLLLNITIYIQQLE